MSAVNKELIEVYRDIGKTIYNQQEGGAWGDAIVKNIEAFLREVGTSIAFLGSQYRIDLRARRSSLIFSSTTDALNPS